MDDKPPSDFIASVDEMIARHFAVDARFELRKFTKEQLNWDSVEAILQRLILCSIAHARNQVDGRKTGTMTFDEAMRLIATKRVMVTRPSWNVFCAVRMDEHYLDDTWVKEVHYWKLDNCDGNWSGDGWPYNPTDEDRAATDWMLYQAPQENWVELHLS